MSGSVLGVRECLAKSRVVHLPCNSMYPREPGSYCATTVARLHFVSPQWLFFLQQIASVSHLLCRALMLARGVFLIGLTLAAGFSLRPAGAEVTRGALGGSLPHLGRALRQANQSDALAPILASAQRKAADATTAAIRIVCLNPNMTVRTTMAASISQSVAQGLMEARGSNPSCQPSLAAASQLAKAVADSANQVFINDNHSCLEAVNILNTTSWVAEVSNAAFTSAATACTANQPTAMFAASIVDAVARGHPHKVVTRVELSTRTCVAGLKEPRPSTRQAGAMQGEHSIPPLMPLKPGRGVECLAAGMG
ncbi:hypothetical protein HaLaN_19819 [Haematococcus lacustris]|uniref:Uncharacterized protein n=1 Tax=Haematococcus lacustris TaxID=44745 RepID=A0A699ZIG9_HAELA|nr:hypothetical protein HaLaN_19819 [Haematococcus lacustris]